MVDKTLILRSFGDLEPEIIIRYFQNQLQFVSHIKIKAIGSRHRHYIIQSKRFQMFDLAQMYIRLIINHVVLNTVNLH